MTKVFENENYIVFVNAAIGAYRITKKNNELFDISLEQDIIDNPGVYKFEIHGLSCGAKSLQEIQETIRLCEIANSSIKEMQETLNDYLNA